MPACSSTALIAGIGPRPMISGRIAATEDAMIRARGFRPSSRALSSDITSIAAAPSLSGHALPAVTEPSGLKTGLSSASFSTVVPGRGPSSRVTVCAATTSPPASCGLGDLDADDLAVEVAAVARRQRALLRQRRPLILGLTGDLAALGDVLGRDAHRDVDVVTRAVGAVDARIHQRETSAPRRARRTPPRPRCTDRPHPP